MISAVSYKDQSAVLLSNGIIRATVLPSWGAKVISLVHEESGKETLWQNPSPTFARTRYGDPFDKGECAGIDEMFPTISACRYDADPWAGTEIPDHGEVWSIPWEAEIHRDSITLFVKGVRLPYELKKTVSLEGSRLMSRYTLVNGSEYPLQFIWAAHPLFRAAEGMRLVVPPGMDRIINAVAGPVLGGPGERYSFPVARRADGTEVVLATVPARNDHGYQKYWFADRATEGWCILHDPETRLNIGLSFPKEQVPFLGIWLNEGGFQGYYNIALEPAMAAMDRIDAARAWGMESRLEPGEARQWHLAITLSTCSIPLGMTPSGDFRE